MKNTKKFTFIIIFSIILIVILFLLYLRNENDIKMTSQGLDVKKYIGLNKYEYRSYKGKGVTIAIIDSGISLHRDFNKNRILKFEDFVNNIKSPYDDYGHGTFVAGIIGADGKYKGIAPKSNLIILKALDKNGEASTENLISALTWVIEYKDKYSIDIVNLSFGVTPLTNRKVIHY